MLGALTVVFFLSLTTATSLTAPPFESPVAERLPGSLDQSSADSRVDELSVKNSPIGFRTSFSDSEQLLRAGIGGGVGLVLGGLIGVGVGALLLGQGNSSLASEGLAAMGAVAALAICSGVGAIAGALIGAYWDPTGSPHPRPLRNRGFGTTLPATTRAKPPVAY